MLLNMASIYCGAMADDVPGCGDVECIKNITSASSRHIFPLWKLVTIDEIERMVRF